MKWNIEVAMDGEMEHRSRNERAKWEIESSMADEMKDRNIANSKDEYTNENSYTNENRCEVPG